MKNINPNISSQVKVAYENMIISDKAVENFDINNNSLNTSIVNNINNNIEIPSKIHFGTKTS